MLAGGPAPATAPAGRMSFDRDPSRREKPDIENPYASPADITPAVEPSTARWTDLRMTFEEDPEDDGRLPLAPRLVRLGGAMVDGFLMLGVAVLAIFAFGSKYGEVSELQVIGYQAMAVTLLIQGGLIAFRGQSVGKIAMGMRIVNVDDDEIPGFVRGVLIRTWLPVLLSLIPFFKLIDILCIYNAEHRCLHDLIAGTRVVDIRESYIRL